MPRKLSSALSLDEAVSNVMTMMTAIDVTAKMMQIDTLRERAQMQEDAKLVETLIRAAQHLRAEWDDIKRQAGGRAGTPVIFVVRCSCCHQPHLASSKSKTADCPDCTVQGARNQRFCRVCEKRHQRDQLEVIKKV